MEDQETEYLPVITVKQPWAELIMSGVKDVENRHFPWRHRGRLWIHAGSTSFDVAAARALGPRGERLYDRTLVQGVILGSVEIYDVTSAEHLAGNRWANRGSYHWLLRKPLRMADPLPWQGAQGIRFAFAVPVHLTREHRDYEG